MENIWNVDFQNIGHQTKQGKDSCRIGKVRGESHDHLTASADPWVGFLGVAQEETLK